MAFVGISNKLMDDVFHVIDRMSDAEIKSVKQDIEYRVTTENDWFVTQAWGANLHLRDQIPKEWMQTDRHSACFYVDLDVHDRCRFEVSMPSEAVQWFPPKYSSYEAFAISEHAEGIPETVRQMIENRRVIMDIRSRWKGINDQVRTFLKNCKSLNEAIKLWPDLEHYIPKEYIERTLEKRSAQKTISKAAEILGTIDTQAVKASAVIARMAGATV